MTSNPFLPFSQDFDWRYDPNSGLVYSRNCYEDAPWLDHGYLGDVLEHVSGGLYWSSKWDKAKAKFVPASCVVDSAWLPLSTIAEATGLRRLSPETWRATAPNPVFHPEFGPCIIRAIDGVHAILVSGVGPSPSWLMAHVNNITGPLTTSPVHPSSWAPTLAKVAARATRKERGLQSPSESLAEVLALLEALPLKPKQQPEV